ncbi:MAG TPA: AraC family transcriptional regulator [Bacteroides sp.]|nr:AraC family transcriptional regulator [Bacteroides sp.]
MDGEEQVQETLMIRNMVSNCCSILLRERLEAAGIMVQKVQLGQAVIFYPRNSSKREQIPGILKEIGLDLIESREEVLVEQIKQAVIELIHHMNNVDSVVRKSDYLVEKIGYSYPHLSKLFHAHEPVTLERYVILQKIERIKQLIDNDEFTLSEIAFMMDYSSVQYLSGQFHKITGMTVSDYKASDRSSKRPLDRLF